MGRGRESTGPPWVPQRCLARTMVEVTSRALANRDCADLGPATNEAAPDLSYLDHQPVAAVAGVDPAGKDPAGQERTGEPGPLDAALVARWFAEQYPDQSYPAVVIGSPHGAAAHLAAAMGAPFLPAGFEAHVTAGHWPADDVGSAIRFGRPIAERVVAGNPDIAVRQVHDPLCPGDLSRRQIRLHLAWRGLPEAYRTLLERQLRPAGGIVIVGDERTWPQVAYANTGAFQLGSPGLGLEWSRYRDAVSSEQSSVEPSMLRCPWRTGRAELGIEPELEADIRVWAASAMSPIAAIGYDTPDGLSAAVAEVARSWLRSAGKTGNRLVVESARMLDPYHVGRAGLVPYWCEAATPSSVTAAELWVAGCQPFTCIDILPSISGREWRRTATLEQWQAIAAFAARRGVVGTQVARSYPLRPLAPRDATGMLDSQPFDLPAPSALTTANLLAALRSLGKSSEGSLAGLSRIETSTPSPTNR